VLDFLRHPRELTFAAVAAARGKLQGQQQHQRSWAM